MMTQQKLPPVKASLAMLAPNLTQKNRVAIVVYAGAGSMPRRPFEGGRSFYTQTVDVALAEIERLPGRHQP
jgi:hypothetical protein